MNLDIPDDIEAFSSFAFLKTLSDLKNQIDQLFSDLKTNKFQDKKKSASSKKSNKSEKVYALTELHKEFLKKHQITESITEKQLDSYLQYYFDVKTNEMKPIQDEYKKWLNLPDRDYAIIKQAFDERKPEVIPKKEDTKYFIGLLENKKASVELNDAIYNLQDPKELINNRELFTVSHNGDKIKPKTLYTMNVAFADVLKDAGVLPYSFDVSKAYTEVALIELFNKYNYNQSQLYQQIDPRNLELLTALGVDASSYVVLDYIYMRPRVLKEHLTACCEEGNNLKQEIVELLEPYKLTTLTSLHNYLKIITVSE